MSSPFKMFRQHQRVLTVVLTGLAMISFVLLGAIDDPRNTPPTLIILFLAAMAGLIAWMAGLKYGKGSEWGLTGVVLGTAIGVLFALYSRESSAVYIDNGNLTSQDLSQLRRERFLANQFARMAFARTGQQGQRNQFEFNFVLPRYLFGINRMTDEITTDDVVLGVLMRRKADEMGITISDRVVTEYIRELTGDKMTADLFRDIRTQLQVSESRLLDALREELKAKQAFRLLYPEQYRMLYEPPLPGQLPPDIYGMFFPDHAHVLTQESTVPLPPEAYWDFHRKLNVQQSVEVAGIPLSSFIDADADPPEAELLELFAEYRSNFPNITSEGRRDEGRPGFMQPRRVRAGYLEAVYDDIEFLMPEPTEEEIKERYEQEYKRAMPIDDDGPLLPELDLPDAAPDGSAPALPESPSAEEAAPDAAPSSESPQPDDGDAPRSDDAPKPDGDSEPGDTPKQEDAPKPEDPSDDAPPSDPETPDSTFLNRPGRLQQVAFLEQEESDEPSSADAKPEPEESPKDQPADATPAEDSPAKETPGDAPEATSPAADKSDSEPPAEKPSEEDPPSPEKPAEEKPSEEAPGTTPPPAPDSEIRPLDDDLSMEIRDELLRERTQRRIRELTEQAFNEMNRLALNMQYEPDSPEHVTLDQAREQLERFAEENGLIYLETPLLSYDELLDSEDFGIGLAQTTLGGRRRVADVLFQTAPSDLYRVFQAEDPATGSGFACWKLEDREAYAPETLDDPLVRDQVIETWRRLQALPKAEARAEDVAELVRDREEPMAELLADVTRTGKEDDLLLEVRETGRFSWLSRSTAPQTDMFQEPPIRPTVIPGLEDVGERFFETVVNELQVGEVGIAPNEDGSVLYVVRVQERFPADEEDQQRLYEQFLQSGFEETYANLGMQALGEFSVNWVERLFEKHSVQIVEVDR
jgi:hypothetical protein